MEMKDDCILRKAVKFTGQKRRGGVFFILWVLTLNFSSWMHSFTRVKQGVPEDGELLLISVHIL